MASTPAKGRARKGASRSSSTRRGWRRWAAWLAVPALVVGLLLGAFLLVAFVRVPLPEDIAPGATTVLDRDGEMVGSLTGETTRLDVAFDELPNHTRYAVLAAEDRNFYTHGGVSPLGILRALYVNVRAGGIEQGGSTITQQYVKNAVVGDEQSLTRKVREAALAIKLDREYDKDTVLQWYLDTIYWGRGAYGIGAAAETYFGVPATELTLNQSATLAGMIQAPERLDPLDAADAADTRRRYVLDGLLEEGWITQDAHDRAIDAGLPEVSRDSALASTTAPYYLDAVRRELQQVLGDSAPAGDVTVHTGLDLDAQRAAEQAVRDALADHGFEADALSAAVVSVDPATGQVRTLVGGPDIAEQQFNAAVQARRQIGSTFKPFTLAAWLGDGRSPESRIEAPAEYDVPDTDATISDYADQDRGVITVFEALQVSANTVFAQMQQELGADPIVDVSTAMGLPSEVPGPDGEPVEAFSRVPSMTLGVDGFTPLEVTEAYNTFATEGLHVDAHTVVRVEDASGEVVYEAETAGDAAISANDARTATEAMTRVIEGGTGTAADIGRPAAGKTGTTQENTDGWFAGYTPEMTTVAWVGDLDSDPVPGLSGGNLPAQLWNQVMTAALEGVEPTGFTAPDLEAYEVINPAPEPCPEGYREADEAPDEPTDGGTPAETRTEIAPGTEDRRGGPCIRIVTVEPTGTPTPTESEEPSETSTPTESPSPTPDPTTEEPTSEPTTETASPTPTETSTDDGPGDGEVLPAPSPTSSSEAA